MKIFTRTYTTSTGSIVTQYLTEKELRKEQEIEAERITREIAKAEAERIAKLTPKEQLEAKLEKLKNSQFYLNMKDHWTEKDFEEDNKLDKEIYEVKKALAEMA